MSERGGNTGAGGDVYRGAGTEADSGAEDGVDKDARGTDTGRSVPVLEVGGTHVTAALVRLGGARSRVLASHREPLDGHAGADRITATLLHAAHALPSAPPARWGVALPGPFDYARGIARYRGVGKFDALEGTDLGALLRAGLPSRTGAVFLNDAEAFLRGEWAEGAGRGHARVVGITLGTGVGSAFLHDGAAVNDGPTVPPEGRADLLTHHGAPLEDRVSRRALIAAYRQASGRDLDVREIAAEARGGDGAARRVLDDAFAVLGETLGPWLRRFGATALVVGGSMTGSWDLIGPALTAGLPGDLPPPLPAARPAEAGLIGAARYAAEVPEDNDASIL
ncbi:ROK family protein [Streptomyces sp. NPDC008139]|uniref:ROK family protein n=1 Tax=Streptomyces sp. NPDC008139 TaxID=3364814 RepID=UPI0036EEBFEE